MLSLIFMGAICSCNSLLSNNDSNDTENVSKDANSDIEQQMDEVSIQKLIDKYDKNGWTEAEYSKALDVIEQSINEYYDKVDSLFKRYDNEDDFNAKMKKLSENYDYIQDLIKICNSSEVSAMGQQNFERYDTLKREFNRKETKLGESIYYNYKKKENDEMSRGSVDSSDTVKQNTTSESVL